MITKLKKNPNKCACENWQHYSSYKNGKKLIETGTTYPYKGSWSMGGFYLIYDSNGTYPFVLVAENDESYIDMPVSYCPCCGKKLDWNQITEKEIYPVIKLN